MHLLFLLRHQLFTYTIFLTSTKRKQRNIEGIREMAKRLKLRIYRVFQSCRSKEDASSLPSDPVPSFLLPPSKPRRSSFLNRHALVPYGCGCGCRSRPPSSHSRRLSGDGDRAGSQPRFHWKREGNFHVMATARDDPAPRGKIYNSSASGGSDFDYDDNDADVVLTLSSAAEKMERRVKNKKKKKTGVRIRGRLSTSSMDSGLFSSEDRGGGDEDEEMETLVFSSRSFSTTDASPDHLFNSQLETINEAPRRSRRRRRRRKKKTTVKANMARKSSSAEAEAEAARLSVFRKMMPCGVMEGKVRESFAVVKRTEDPREDFKRSMVEMIVEKQMFAEEDLRQLLRCLLSLNSRDHHGVIMDAFSEIWDALFGRRSSSGGR